MKNFLENYEMYTLIFRFKHFTIWKNTKSMKLKFENIKKWKPH